MVRFCQECEQVLRHEEVRKTPRVVASTDFCPDCGTQLTRTGGCGRS